MKKLLKVMGVVAICAAFAVVVYNQVNAKPENPILAKNIEALSSGENLDDNKWSSISYDCATMHGTSYSGRYVHCFTPGYSDKCTEKRCVKE